MDTNILPTFARVDELELLFVLFSRSPLGVTAAIREEAKQAGLQGCIWLGKVQSLLESGRLELVTPGAEEAPARQGLPSSLGPGEREAIAVSMTGDRLPASPVTRHSSTSEDPDNR